MLSRSASSFSVELVTKKGRRPWSCIDYRQLNRTMKPDRWRLPKFEELFDELSGAKFITTPELYTGYWHVKIAENCKVRTTFVSRYGTSKFELMQFGLMNLTGYVLVYGGRNSLGTSIRHYICGRRISFIRDAE